MVSTTRGRIAAALRQARLEAGFDSQAKLAKQLHMSRPSIAKAESPNGPVPSDALLVLWARETGADLQELLELATRARSSTPEWFMPYRKAEQEAGNLRLWSPIVVPGILQTEAYARALLSARKRTPDQIQALVDQRLERQQVIGHADVTAVIDYRVLAHVVGSPVAMAGQCADLAELVESGKISLHVLPEGANIGTGGAFSIATRGIVSTVCLTTSSRDITSTAADVIEENMNLFDAVLGASLAVVQTLEYVRTQEEIWKEHS
jgi:transcriptional regulator with XRE-family HTH domain